MKAPKMADDPVAGSVRWEMGEATKLWQNATGKIVLARDATIADLRAKVAELKGRVLELETSAIVSVDGTKWLTAKLAQVRREALEEAERACCSIVDAHLIRALIEKP